MSNAIDKELKQQHPDQPWLWRSSWNEGVIKTRNKAGMSFIWILAISWNAISWLVTVLALPKQMEEENYIALVMLLFPLVGIIIVGYAIRSTCRYLKFGESIFQLAFTPGVIGGALTGVIRTSVKIAAEDGFNLTLSCIFREVRGHGKQRRTHEAVLWQSMQKIKRELETNNANESGIPVQFAVPFECHPSTIEKTIREGVIIWKLEAKANTPGVDYLAEFEVPVFKTEESSPNFKADFSLVEEYVHDPTLVEVYQEAKLVRKQTTNGCEIRFPLFRNAKQAIGATVFLAIWCGATALLGYGTIDFTESVIQNVFGIIFVGVFGLFALLLFLVTVDLWLWHGTVSINSERVEAKTGIPFMTGTRTFASETVKSVSFKKSMTVGQIVYHDLKLETSDGKTQCIGRRIVNEAAVRKIVDDISMNLGLIDPERESSKDSASPRLSSDGRQSSSFPSVSMGSSQGYSDSTTTS